MPYLLSPEMHVWLRPALLVRAIVYLLVQGLVHRWPCDPIYANENQAWDLNSNHWGREGVRFFSSQTWVWSCWGLPNWGRLSQGESKQGKAEMREAETKSWWHRLSCSIQKSLTPKIPGCGSILLWVKRIFSRVYCLLIKILKHLEIL